MKITIEKLWKMIDTAVDLIKQVLEEVLFGRNDGGGDDKK
jgi:hypothetical protein